MTRPKRRSGHARSFADAINRCGLHGRGALAETLAGARAAIDAASFALFACPADQSALEPFWLLADELGRGLSSAGPEAESLLRIFAEALDEEIERWERQGRDDPDARAVSRVFAELRDLLREFGMPEVGPRRAPRRSSAAGHRARQAQRPL